MTLDLLHSEQGFLLLQQSKRNVRSHLQFSELRRVNENTSSRSKCYISLYLNIFCSIRQAAWENTVKPITRVRVDCDFPPSPPPQITNCLSFIRFSAQNAISSLAILRSVLCSKPYYFRCQSDCRRANVRREFYLIYCTYNRKINGKIFLQYDDIFRQHIIVALVLKLQCKF